MAVDAATVRRIAHLARIAVAEEEIEPLQGELNAILAFVEQLSEVDVEGVEPMTSVTPMDMKKRRGRGHRWRHSRRYRQERADDGRPFLCGAEGGGMTLRTRRAFPDLPTRSEELQIGRPAMAMAASENHQCASPVKKQEYFFRVVVRAISSHAARCRPA